MRSNKYHSSSLVGHDELFVRAGYLVHATRGQNVEEWDKWDKPEARPPNPALREA